MQTNIRQCKKKIVDKTISNEIQSDERKRFAETVLMVKKPNGQGQMLRVLFDSGCSKTIILKMFTDKKKRKRLPDFKSTTYKTYGGYFRSSCLASVQFKFIEFGLLKDRLVEYEVQVDEMQQQKDTNYDMIIGSDLMDDLGIVLDYYDKVIRIKNSQYEDSIPMKNLVCYNATRLVR